MKENKAPKLMLLLVVVLYACAAKSQDSTDYTLNNIKKYASRMDESFPALSNRTGNERRTCIQAAERLKAISNSIETEMEYLPDDYYFRLSPLVSAYRADIDEYEKLVINEDFEGKEKCLSAAFYSLQQRQASFRRALALAYQNAVSPDVLPENTPAKDDDNTMQVPPQPAAGNDNTTAQENEEQATEPAGDEALKNAILLDTIHTALQQIEGAIHLMEHAVAKNDVSTIRLGTTRIADASLKISGLSLLLNTKGKENLYMLAASLRHTAENLRTLAKKGTPARNEMKDSLGEIKIKFSNLSTGISFVK